MTRQYAESLREAIDPYFEPASTAGHRWSKRPGAPGIPILIDFLATRRESTPVAADGSLDSPVENVGMNLGIALTPFAIRAGAVIDEDVEAMTLEDVDLLFHRATADVDLRYAGPVGFLMAKADALYERNETKDGYDVAWWAIHAGPTVEATAALVTRRPAFRHELFPEAVAELRRAFKSPDAPGPHGYATELHPDLQPGDHLYDIAKNQAFATVSAVVDALAAELWR